MKKAVILVSTIFGLTCGAAAQSIPSGTQVDVRTNETIDVRDSADGRVYTGTIASDVMGNNGQVSIPRGSPAELIVRWIGAHEMAIDLDSVSVNGRRYSVQASSVERGGGEKQGIGENKRTGEYVGGGALLGTLLGAIAGGGKGAAIGALAGGAAGGGAQVLTRGQQIRVPAETVLSFRIQRPLDVYQDAGYDRDGRHYHNNFDYRQNNNNSQDNNYYNRDDIRNREYSNQDNNDRR